MSLPERLGRLQRSERIGVGGFATVWLYRDTELHSDVAVKALADNWAQRIDVRERFLEEARLLRRADSDHVVHVYDIGEVDATPYFVMTYADQGSLGDRLAAGQRPGLGEIRDLIDQAATGLAVLHEHGVVHRDVKPHNLLLRRSTNGRSRVLVADLGVAKQLLHSSGLTQVVGTPAYMAPEQGLGLGVDARADVHGLGAVAYHLLTGRQVRAGSLVDLGNAVAPPPISEYFDAPAGLEAVVARAVAVDPDDRWPDMESFRLAWNEALGQVPNEAAPAIAPPMADTELSSAASSRTPSAPGSSPVSDPDRARTIVTEPSPVPPAPVERSGWWPVVLWSLAAFVLAFAAGYLVTELIGG